MLQHRQKQLYERHVPRVVSEHTHRHVLGRPKQSELGQVLAESGKVTWERYQAAKAAAMTLPRLAATPRHSAPHNMSGLLVNELQVVTGMRCPCYLRTF